ncbi:MAG TPA: hypothetical protein VF057_11500 [Thermoanaerobaculia bacterium]
MAEPAAEHEPVDPDLPDSPEAEARELEIRDMLVQSGLSRPWHIGLL